MTRYEMNDGCDCRETIEATSDEDAVAQTEEWLRSGDWHTDEGTAWIHGSVRLYDTPEHRDYSPTINVTITIEQDEPECTGQEHDWQSPEKVVGGCSENPGCFGHGGGVRITEVCRYCGVYRTTDTWAQDPATGEQGLRSVEYRPADDVSAAWVDRLVSDARSWVDAHEDDDPMDEDDLLEAFRALVGHDPADDDERRDMWSYACAARDG